MFDKCVKSETFEQFCGNGTGAGVKVGRLGWYLDICGTGLGTGKTAV